MAATAVPERMSLVPGVALALGADEASLTVGERSVRLTRLDDGQLAVLRALEGEGAGERELLAARGAEATPQQRAWVHYLLGRLLAAGLARRAIGAPPIALVEAIAPGHQPSGRALPAGARVRLSRFAYARQEGGALVLESPQARSRVLLPDWRGPALLAALAAGTDPAAVELPDGLERADALALATLLCQERFADVVVDEDGGEGDVSGAALAAAHAGASDARGAAPQGGGRSAHAAALAEWEFHDLLFHARSREGRHRNPYGGTYPYEGVREPLPAVKPPPEGERVALARPDLAAARAGDPPFADVLETRRSWRVPGAAPLHADQLGELLYRSARVRGRRGTEHEEVSNRPYPGGGADYELEIYVVAQRVEGLERALHHYDPLGHALTRMRAWDDALEHLARSAARKAPPGELPDALLQITARFGRLTYKYRSIAYAVALKDVGVLYQTLYLSATAMGLAPCALGGGDSDLFANVAGISPAVEPQIGEFMLNTRNADEEAAAPPLPDEPRREG